MATAPIRSELDDLQPPTATAPALGAHVASGVRWGLLNQVVQQAVRFTVQVVLTRLLAPSAFGVMAIALVAVNLGTLVSGLGFAQALIQRRSITHDQVKAALGGSLLLGLGLAAIVAAGAGAAADFFDEPKVAPILRVLSVIFVFQSLEGVPNSMLRRELRFRDFVLSSTIGTVVGAVVGIGLGVAGAGVWALVGFAVTEAATATGLAWILATAAGVWRPAISFDLRPLRSLAGYSGAVTGSRLLVFAIRNVDNIAVGRVLGASALGFYGLAYRLMLQPIARVTDVAHGVALPAFARLASDRRRLADAALRAVRFVTAVLVPVSVGIVVTADVLVPAVFGPEWRPAVDTVRVLCAAGPALALSRLTSSLLEAVGEAGWALKITTITTAVLLPAFVIGVQYGLIGVALAYSITAWFGVLPGLWCVSRCTGATIVRQLRNVAPVAVAAVALAAAALAVGRVVDTGGTTELMAMALAGAVAYGAALRALDPSLVADGAHILRARMTPA